MNFKALCGNLSDWLRCVLTSWKERFFGNVNYVFAAASLCIHSYIFSTSTYFLNILVEAGNSLSQDTHVYAHTHSNPGLPSPKPHFCFLFLMVIIFLRSSTVSDNSLISGPFSVLWLVTSCVAVLTVVIIIPNLFWFYQEDAAAFSALYCLWWRRPEKPQCLQKQTLGKERGEVGI